MTFEAPVQERLSQRLVEIYGARGSEVLAALLELLQAYREDPPHVSREQRWDERDVVLIGYGDQVRQPGCAPLEAFRRFVVDHRLHEVINTIHILPFCPYTSDDGFSVIDYLAVDPELGSWEDLRRLNRHNDLVFDLVLNHVSQASSWFQGYLQGDARYQDYFIEVDPRTDLSAVTRPRSLPLLTEYQTSRGPRHVWTTFSADQVDLNYANPAVLLDVLRTLLFYVRQGARFVRLDAIAYLWKQPGTSCIHLPQTHAIVKLMRDVLQLVAPHVMLLTETNVPHAENISYFGEGDEAHMVYQFSLPPLLADALLRQDARALTDWLMSLEQARAGTTFFNFTASHDGVGVRPLEGLLPAERRAQLVQAAVDRGGLVSTKRDPDGRDTPYELNITYFDLLSDPRDADAEKHIARFLASQAMMLSLRGIPGIYFHSLLGARNDRQAARRTGLHRRINRRKWERAQLDAMLGEEGAAHRRIFDAYRRLLEVRIAQRAFHPEGDQQVDDLAEDGLLALRRSAPDQEQRILVLANLTERSRPVELARWTELELRHDLLTGERPRDGVFSLDPYQVAWFDAR